jgi:hypothetical protein
MPHAKEFGVLNVLEKGPSQISTHWPTEAEKAKEHYEFRINNSYIHLTLVNAAWTWGHPPPSPINRNKRDGTSKIGEVEFMNQFVEPFTCWYNCLLLLALGCSPFLCVHPL